MIFPRAREVKTDPLCVRENNFHAQLTPSSTPHPLPAFKLGDTKKQSYHWSISH